MSTDVSTQDSTSSEQFMLTMAVTSTNKSSMLEAHKTTFPVRRKFIDKKGPLIKTVLDWYPRFRDLPVEMVNYVIWTIFSNLFINAIYFVVWDEDFVRQGLKWEDGVKQMFSPSIQLEVDGLGIL